MKKLFVYLLVISLLFSACGKILDSKSVDSDSALFDVTNVKVDSETVSSALSTEVQVTKGTVACAQSGSNLLSVEQANNGEKSHVEVPDIVFTDKEYGLVFYWRMTASQGPWYLQIAPMESEEWHDFRHGKDEVWAGCCNYGEHGFTLLEKYCMNFDSETGDFYQLRCVSEGDPEREDGSVVWQVENIPITGADAMLTKGLSEGYSGWETGRLIIMVDKMEYCSVCPSAWRPENQ